MHTPFDELWLANSCQARRPIRPESGHRANRNCASRALAGLGQSSGARTGARRQMCWASGPYRGLITVRGLGAAAALSAAGS